MKKYFQDLSNGILQAVSLVYNKHTLVSKMSKVLVGKPNKQICTCLATALEDDQTNCNGKTTVMPFRIVFYQCSCVKWP